MTLTFLKKIKTVIEAACGKLDTMESKLNKQQTIITKLQTQVEEMKTEQGDSRVLLEEILFTVSQSNEPEKTPNKNPILENPVQIKRSYEVN